MFTVRERERVRRGLLELARADPVPAVAPPVSHLDDLLGLAWHHVRIARVCIERGRLWQAVHWINGARDQVIALAALRLSLPALYNKSAHLLPAEVTKPLESTLVTALGEAELRRALDGVMSALAAEASRHGAGWLAAELRDF